MKLWTVWCDYFATGEGRTLAAWIGHAETQSEAIELFAEKFNPYFSRGGQAEEGVAANEVVSFLFSQSALESLKGHEGVAFIDAAASVHINMS